MEREEPWQQAGTIQQEQLGWHQKGTPSLLTMTASGCEARICCLPHSLLAIFSPNEESNPALASENIDAGRNLSGRWRDEKCENISKKESQERA